MIKEVKNLFFTCNGCGLDVFLREVFEGTLPPGWTYALQYNQLVYDGYQSQWEPMKDFATAEHNCKKCSEKREIKEVFK